MTRKEILLKKRYNAEKRFRLYGQFAIGFALFFLFNLKQILPDLSKIIGLKKLFDVADKAFS